MALMKEHSSSYELETTVEELTKAGTLQFSI